MSKILRRARVKRENAESDYQKIGIDDAYLDDCCFNLQQCIELLLKYAVEMHGGRYVENHDIRAQMNILNKLDVSVPGAETLRQNAETINSWETSSRYKDDFIALIEDIDAVRGCADALLNYLEEMTAEQQLETMQTFPDSRL